MDEPHSRSKLPLLRAHTLPAWLEGRTKDGLLSPSPNNPHNISVICYNARSLIHKVDKLCANCLLYKPDIICVVETWSDHIANSEIAIPNLTVTRLDRDGHGRGIAIYIANHLSFSVVSSGPSYLEFLVISVKHSHDKLGVSLSLPKAFLIHFHPHLDILILFPYFLTCYFLVI